MDGHNARSVKNGLSDLEILRHRISTQKKSHLPLLISCSASCRP
ncbi:hypothetical protein T11_11191 [Trichinella zimbabwensis]|uniref:Uncharacterized protein n=1 Tax=Trichinella zimbabwensis TaxID=268475 RepID=A0A0V1GHZ7_9BILA|nr:hypothetical protein T11_11191 [Trichinella zimbabwensis]